MTVEEKKMSTWAQDLRKANPELADAYMIIGNQSTGCLRMMVKALESLPALNNQDDWARLRAARYILQHRLNRGARSFHGEYVEYECGISDLD